MQSEYIRRREGNFGKLSLLIRKGKGVILSTKNHSRKQEIVLRRRTSGR